MEAFTHHAAKLFLDWFNRRFERAFAIQGGGQGEVTAVDGDHRLLLLVHPLYEEATPDWQARRAELEERLSSGMRGPFVVWAPPRAPLPAGEPDASEFVQRVQQAAASLAPGGRAEAHLPVTLRVGRSQEDGAYVSVVGGLSRYWTTISESVRGVYHLDSHAVHRTTTDEERRKGLFRTLGEACAALAVGEGAEVAGEDAWTVQRLPKAEPGFERTVIIGCPPSIDPTDGAALRRLLRKRLADANERLASVEREVVRAVALVSIWEYADEEGVSTTLRGMDSALFRDIDVIGVLADGGVRMALSPRALPWGNEP